MPYSNMHQMRARVKSMRTIAEKTPDPETRRLILQQAEKLEVETNAMEQAEHERRQDRGA